MLGSPIHQWMQSNTSETSELMKELDTILGSSYPLLEEDEKNVFEINIVVDSIEKTVGVLTVKPIKYIAR